MCGHPFCNIPADDCPVNAGRSIMHSAENAGVDDFLYQIVRVVEAACSA
jgi:hypothetical protein